MEVGERPESKLVAVAPAGPVEGGAVARGVHQLAEAGRRARDGGDVFGAVDIRARPRGPVPAQHVAVVVGGLAGGGAGAADRGEGVASVDVGDAGSGCISPETAALPISARSSAGMSRRRCCAGLDGVGERRFASRAPVVAPGPQDGTAVRAAEPTTLSSWRAWPQLNEHKNVRSVDGANTSWPSTASVPPERSTSASSMESPPASAEWTSVIALWPTLARPAASPRSTCSSKSWRSPKCWANVAVSIKPALAIRRSSSKVTSRRSRLWQDTRIEIVPSRRGCGRCGNHHLPLQEGTIRGCASALRLYSSVDPG